MIDTGPKYMLIGYMRLLLRFDRLTEIIWSILWHCHECMEGKKKRQDNNTATCEEQKKKPQKLVVTDGMNIERCTLCMCVCVFAMCVLTGS